MNRVLRTTYIFILVFLFANMRSQHNQYSQFYSAQTYLNPAFTGANVCARLTTNYRKQWSAIPGTFTTYQVAFDHSWRRFNSGVGFLVNSDNAGSGSLKSTQFSLLYAYELRLHNKFSARAGFSAGGVQRSIDYSALTFGDQIARGGASSSVENLSTYRATYFDMAFGILLYSQNDFMGFSVSHLNKPNQALINGTSRLPSEYKFHGGHTFLLGKDASITKKADANSISTMRRSTENSITVAFNYKKQQKFNQLDLGFYYSKNIMTYGVWYRGIPLYKPFTWYSSNDAVILVLGVTLEKLKIGYSYDFTISKLSNLSSRGSNEISLSYQFCNQKKRKRSTILISCPKF